MSLQLGEIDGTPDGQTEPEVRSRPNRKPEEREEEGEKMGGAEQAGERLQPEGKQAEGVVTESNRRQVRPGLGSEAFGSRFPSAALNFLFPVSGEGRVV